MKRGFTLVELLAVIVILSIIGLISVPIITSNIEKSRKSAYRSSVQNAIAAAKEYVSKNMEDNDFPEGGISVTTIKYKKDQNYYNMEDPQVDFSLSYFVPIHTIPNS